MIVSSYTVRIWMAGDYQDAKRAVREFCYREGSCFSLHPVEFIYTAGQEAGVCVTRIHYARFPTVPEAIDAQCRRLAEQLEATLCQRSYSIEGPHATEYVEVSIPATAAAQREG